MDYFTIERFLENPTIKDLRLVAGAQGKQNAIFNANIIDNPDSYEWFTAGDFILTTGYIFKDNLKLQKELVKELSEMNCAGLGIKIQRYWKEIPQIIIEEAEKYQLPIIEIPFVYSLAQVSNYINHTLSNRENSLLHKYKNIHEAFNRTLLEDGDFFDIVKLAADFVKNPVILVNRQFDLLSYFDYKNNPKPLKSYLNLTVGSRTFTREFTADIPTSPDKFTLSIKRKFPDQNDGITCRIIPVAYAKDLYGYIIAWETMHKLESIDYVALETATITAAIRQIKLLQIEESRSRMRDSFFDDLLQDRIISLNNLKSLAKIHGLEANANHQVAIIDIDSFEAPIHHQVFDIILEQASEYNIIMQVIKRQTKFVIIFDLPRHIASYENEIKIKEFFNTVVDKLKEIQPTLSFEIGVGSEVKELQEISRSYLLAQEMIDISEKIDMQNNIFYFNDLKGYHLLQQNINQNELIVFFNEILGEVDKFDKENNADLIKTLEMYFKHNANLSEAAKMMYVHRNTFIYRLEKIKKLLNSDLKNSEENFNYMLALHIKKIINF